MRVVQVLYSGLGGHGSVAFSLAAASAAHWQSHLIFFGIEPLLPEYEKLCRERGIALRYVPVTPGRAWESWRALHKALSQAKPDAILLHSVKTILPCWLYARRHRLPIVAVEHQQNELKKHSEWVVSRLLMRLADAVVVLTPQYRDALQAGLGRAFRADKVQIIPNGIDTAIFVPQPRAVSVDPGTRRVGMASRFTSNKRQDVLVDALNLLRQRGAANWTLSLAGSGETLIAVRQRAEAAGLADRVEFPGYLGEAALRDWFEGLDIYVQASDGETLPTSILQAMAQGLPIVGSNVPGISELLAKSGGCGIVAENSGGGFARALQRLTDEPALANALARNARKLAEDEYSQDAMFAAYRKLLPAA